MLKNSFSRVCREYLPAIIPNRRVAFYLNTLEPFEAGALPTLLLDIINEQGAVLHSNLSGATADLIEDGVVKKFSVIVELDVPAGLSNGTVFFVLKFDGVATLLSNPFRVAATAKEQESLMLCRYRNSKNTHGYNYEGNPNFVNEIYLDLAMVNEETESEVETYKSQSDGTHRNPRFDLDMVLTLETIGFDSPAHRAASVMFGKHDFLEIDGLRLKAKEAYQFNKNRRLPVSDGTVQLYEVGTFNKQAYEY